MKPILNSAIGVKTHFGYGGSEARFAMIGLRIAGCGVLRFEANSESRLWGDNTLRMYQIRGEVGKDRNRIAGGGFLRFESNSESRHRG